MLFQYRITPHTTTGIAPAELLMRRKLCSRFDMLKPQVEQVVQNKQQQQKVDHDKRSQVRHFSTGDKVFVKNHRQGDSWLPGEISEKLGHLSFKVLMPDGRFMHCHQDHLRKRDKVAAVPDRSTDYR